MMPSKHLALTSTAFFSLLAGCSSPSAVDASDDALEGTFVEVAANGANLPVNLRNVYGAVGRIAYATGFEDVGKCTGVHIGDGLFITAGHCISHGEFFARETPREDPKARPFVRASVTFASGETATAVLLDAELSLQRDFAILKLDKTPKFAIPARLGKVAYGTKLSMLSYPSRVIQQQGQGNNIDATKLMFSSSCTFDDASKMTDKTGYVDLRTNHFGHECASDPGSSGAPVFDALTGEVVGLNLGEIDQENYGLALDSTPFAQYVNKLPDPKFTVTLETDGAKSADKFLDATVAADAGTTVASVAFTLVPCDDSGRAVTAPVTVAEAPFTARLDTTKASDFYAQCVHTVATDTKGASLARSVFVEVEH